MALRPAKVIQGMIRQADPVETWDYDAGTGDPWVGYPYVFDLTVDITMQPHSSWEHGVNQFFYGVGDIRVGDYLFSSGGGRVLRVREIVSIEDPTVVLRCEDIDRTNALNDATQSGQSGIEVSDCFLFEAPDGIPVLYPLPPNDVGTIPSNAIAQILSRFAALRRADLVEVVQIDHGFVVGNAVELQATGFYELASSDDTGTLTVAGTVVEVQDTASGPHKFYYRPVGPVVRVPMPAGNPGDLVYVGPVPGSLTCTEPSGQAVPVYIRLDDDRGILLSRAQPLPVKLDVMVTAATVIRGHRMVTHDGQEADPANPAHHGRVLGMALHAANQGAPVRVRIAGEVVDPSFSFDPTGLLFLGTEGGIMQAVPAGVAFIQRVGHVLEPQRIVLAIQPPILTP